MYISLTQVAPAAGGQYIEGVVAQPRYVNPILAQTSEADADLSELIYAGLFDYDRDGKLAMRMAREYQVSDDGKKYTVYLKTNILFHDGSPLNAEDVVFTIQAIQDPAYKSPLRANWLGVEVSAPDAETITFELKKPYFGFLENLTVGILPKHIWQEVAPDHFTLADYNLTQPIGSGPYQYDDIDKDAQGNILSYRLQAFSKYFDGEPFIDAFIIRFYPDEESLIDAYNRQEVLGIHSVSPQNLSRLSAKRATRVYHFNLPRLFAVFLNTNKSVALAYDEVRAALSLATNRQAVIDAVLLGKGQLATGPFLPFMFGYNAEANAITFNPDEANAILDKAGWKRNTDGIRFKNDTVLTFELTTPDWPELVLTADLLKEEWRTVGVAVDVKVLSQSDLQQNAIRPREYQALLFGEGAMVDPDPYSFWHSSQKNDPGLNLAFFDNKEADDLLLQAREALDPAKRADFYGQFQQVLKKEHPAVFLYSPTYLYAVSPQVFGIENQNLNTPTSRFSTVREWYMKTKRVKK